MATRVMTTASKGDGGGRQGDTKQNCDDLRHGLGLSSGRPSSFAAAEARGLLFSQGVPASASKYYGLIERANDLLDKAAIWGLERTHLPRRGMQQYVILALRIPSEKHTQSNRDKANQPRMREQDEDANDGHNHAKGSGRRFLVVLDRSDVAHGIRLARHDKAGVRDGHISMLEKYGFARGPGLGKRCAQDSPESLVAYLHNHRRRTADLGRWSWLLQRLSIQKHHCR